MELVGEDIILQICSYSDFASIMNIIKLSIQLNHMKEHPRLWKILNRRYENSILTKNHFIEEYKKSKNWGSSFYEVKMKTMKHIINNFNICGSYTAIDYINKYYGPNVTIYNDKKSHLQLTTLCASTTIKMKDEICIFSCSSCNNTQICNLQEKTKISHDFGFIKSTCILKDKILIILKNSNIIIITKNKENLYNELKYVNIKPISKIHCETYKCTNTCNINTTYCYDDKIVFFNQCGLSVWNKEIIDDKNIKYFDNIKHDIKCDKKDDLNIRSFLISKLCLKNKLSDYTVSPNMFKNIIMLRHSIGSKIGLIDLNNVTAVCIYTTKLKIKKLGIYKDKIVILEKDKNILHIYKYDYMKFPKKTAIVKINKIDLNLYIPNIESDTTQNQYLFAHKIYIDSDKIIFNYGKKLCQIFFNNNTQTCIYNTRSKTRARKVKELEENNDKENNGKENKKKRRTEQTIKIV